MLNWRVLSAWPNWFHVAFAVTLWLIVGVLLAELLGATPYSEQSA